MERHIFSFQCHYGFGSLRRFTGIGCVIFAAVALTGVCRAQTLGQYRVDSEASRIEIHVFRAGLFAALGDNHQIVIGDFAGTAIGGESNSWQVEVVAKSASLRVEDPGISESNRREIQSTMVGPTQLDVERFPTIELRTRSVIPGGTPNTWRLVADLTLHGVTRQVEFPIAWSQDGERLNVKGQVKLRLRDFQIEPISKGLGAVKVKNEFEVVYTIQLRRESQASKSRP
jgi:polyisoprenoid-binding protein YceI